MAFRFFWTLLLAMSLVSWAPGGLAANDPKVPDWSTISDEAKEEFLRNAKVISRRAIDIGITGTDRVTLSDGNWTHDAHFQKIDESKAVFQGVMGNELNFRDCYKFNIAAYHLDRMIGLRMVPVSVMRRIGGREGALTWWLDDIMMMEIDRHKRKLRAPDSDNWNRQMYQVRVFNELVYNTDPNLTNLLICKDWKIWLIDYSRAFRRQETLRSPANLVCVDPEIHVRLKNLSADEMQTRLKPYLNSAELKGLLARRDKIVQFFDEQLAKAGESKAYCAMPAR
jgi:hypothetical protein